MACNRIISHVYYMLIILKCQELYKKPFITHFSKYETFDRLAHTKNSPADSISFPLQHHSFLHQLERSQSHWIENQLPINNTSMKQLIKIYSTNDYNGKGGYSSSQIPLTSYNCSHQEQEVDQWHHLHMKFQESVATNSHRILCIRAIRYD